MEQFNSSCYLFVVHVVYLHVAAMLSIKILLLNNLYKYVVSLNVQNYVQCLHVSTIC